nr:unnamed protein product [Callosobruchus chinensis]
MASPLVPKRPALATLCRFISVLQDLESASSLTSWSEQEQVYDQVYQQQCVFLPFLGDSKNTIR